MAINKGGQVQLIVHNNNMSSRTFKRGVLLCVCITLYHLTEMANKNKRFNSMLINNLMSDDISKVTDLAGHILVFFCLTQPGSERSSSISLHVF